MTNTDSMVKLYSNAYYEGHRGTLFHHSNKVVFYGTMFRDMLSASRVLRHLEPGNTKIYKPFFYEGFRGIIITKDGNVVVDTYEKSIKWFCSTYVAELYCDSVNKE